MSSEKEYLYQTKTGQAFIIREWLEDSDSVHDQLVDLLPWETHTITIHGRTVREPRRSAACGDAGVTQVYSNTKRELIDWSVDERFELVRTLGMKVSEEVELPLNSCLVNYYRDGTDYIGYHRDKELVAPDYAVVSVSLGGSRPFYLKDVKTKEVIKTVLNSGDVFVMSGDFNKIHHHSIPKRSPNKYPESRVSLTYRLLEMEEEGSE